MVGKSPSANISRHVKEGVSKTTGTEEAIAFLERPNRSPSIAAVRFDMLAIAADGNRVQTERLDRFTLRWQ